MMVVIWLVVAGFVLAAAFTLVSVFLAMVGPATPPLQVGMAVPPFELHDQGGRVVRLSDFRETAWVLLYFYPKDQTPGCTREACGFRECYDELSALSLQVLGVSLDSVESHRKFSDRHRLPFPLLSDADHSVSKSYGTLVNLFWIKVPRRNSFLIDPQGKLRKIFPKVDPARHADEVAQIFKELRENES